MGSAPSPFCDRLYSTHDAVDLVRDRALGRVRRDPAAGAHARATTLLLQHPGTGFDEAIEEAQRAIALGQENPSGQPC